MEYFAVGIAAELGFGIAAELGVGIAAELGVGIAAELGVGIAGGIVGLGRLSTIFTIMDPVRERPGYLNISIMPCLREDQEKVQI
jgi:hypothetical protein